VSCSRVIAALLLVLGAACQPLPKPFSHVEPDHAMLYLPDRGGIIVQPMADAPPQTSAALSIAMVYALQQANVPAQTHGGNAESAFLLSRIVDPGHDAHILWELYDDAGEPIGEHQQSIEGTPIPAWAAGDPLLMADLANAAAPEIAAMVQEQLWAEAEPTKVHVAPVVGAPGDGSLSLTRAVKAKLIEIGTELRDEPGANTVTLAGAVDQQPLPGGQEVMLTLTWTLFDAEGVEMGAISQSNAIRKGSLDGAWGPLAVYIAEFVAAGVSDLLLEVDRRRAESAEDGDSTGS